MKLIIQIPCFNEEDTLASVFDGMPKSILGISSIEFQLIDDGSTDSTLEVARSLGIEHIVEVRGENRTWLGRAFKLGIDNALGNGADIVVNTDGDNQYPSKYIEDLVRPIVNGSVDIVIGDRNPGSIKEFSIIKRILQRLGSRVIQCLSGEEVADAVSGFRAYSKDALLKLNVITNFTYTVDTLMQAQQKGIAIAWVPIVPNPKARESRLFGSLFEKVQKSGKTILHLTMVYAPLKTFITIGLIFFTTAVFYICRFLYFYFLVEGRGSGNIQSLVIAGSFLVISVLLFVVGALGNLLAVNRQLIEDVLTRVKKLEIKDSDR